MGSGSGLSSGVPQLAPGASMAKSHPSPGREPGETGRLGETGPDPERRARRAAGRAVVREPAEAGQANRGTTPRVRVKHPREPGDTGSWGEIGIDHSSSVRAADTMSPSVSRPRANFAHLLSG